MTTDEFNIKWNKYLETGHYGLVIEHEDVIKYLDEEFTKEVKTNPTFDYAQIKMKFGTSRVYASSDRINEWEVEINKIINI